MTEQKAGSKEVVQYTVCKRELKADVAQKYYDHIGVFQQGHRRMIPMKEPGTFTYGSHRRAYILTKVDNIRAEYMWNGDEKKDPDATDRAFQAAYTAGTLAAPLRLYGLHSNLGVFFRPDLEEAINLLAPHIGIESLAGKRLYVTTEPHPSDRTSEICDRATGLHRGETVVYTIPVATSPPGGPTLA